MHYSQSGNPKASIQSRQEGIQIGYVDQAAYRWSRWHELIGQHVALIKQEHRVFSAYAEASSSVDYVTASSIVFGKYFRVIHSYYFGIRNDTYGFLILRTYSSHGNRRYQAVRLAFIDVVQETEDYLKASHSSQFVVQQILLGNVN